MNSLLPRVHLVVNGTQSCLLGTIGLVSFLITLLGYHLGIDKRIQNQGGSPASVASEETLSRELQLVGERVIAVIENGDPNELLALCSRRGVAFGIDFPPISLASIRKQIHRKRGIYCGLFNTDCARKEDQAVRAKAGAPKRKQPLYSYREIFQKAVERELKVSVQQHSATWSGYVTVFLKGDSEVEIFQMENPIEFEFVHEAGQWKLSSMPNY